MVIVPAKFSFVIITKSEAKGGEMNVTMKERKHVVAACLTHVNTRVITWHARVNGTQTLETEFAKPFPS